jgi:hypothetical protein
MHAAMGVCACLPFLRGKTPHFVFLVDHRRKRDTRTQKKKLTPARANTHAHTHAGTLPRAHVLQGLEEHDAEPAREEGAAD